MYWTSLSTPLTPLSAESFKLMVFVPPADAGGVRCPDLFRSLLASPERRIPELPVNVSREGRDHIRVWWNDGIKPNRNVLWYEFRNRWCCSIRAIANTAQ